MPGLICSCVVITFLFFFFISSSLTFIVAVWVHSMVGEKIATEILFFSLFPSFELSSFDFRLLFTICEPARPFVTPKS